jgi:hypothetical protein
MTWKLVDTERWAESHPDTFEIPSVEERMSLRVGDVAKVIFESLKPGYEPERMWVVVTEIHEPGKYTGEVDNHSFNPNLPRLSDPVLFESKNVMQLIRFQ